MPQDFLFYQEKFTKVEGDNVLTKKQTYSAWVDLPVGPKKWHLTAYFTIGTIHSMNSCALVHDSNTFLAPPFTRHPLLSSHLAPTHLPTLPPPLACLSSLPPTPVRSAETNEL